MSNQILIKILPLFLFLYCSHVVAINDKNEEVIYNVQNTIDKTINAIEITHGDTKEQLFYRSVDGSPVSRNTWNLSSSWHIGAFAPDSGDPVPEQVEISWRNLPQQGQALYRGDIEGPYTIKVRSRIPADVLKKSREAGYDLSLMFLVGKQPVTFCWRLGDYKSSPPSNITLQQGGDCISDPYLKNTSVSINNKPMENITKLTAQPKNENWSIIENKDPKIKTLKIFILNTENSRYSPIVPEELEVSWTKASNKEVYTKEKIVGPFVLKVRPLIPPDILKLTTNRYHHITLSIKTNNDPPTVCWKLWDYSESHKGKLVKAGGDC